MAYVPTTWPGARLPHVWLDDGSAVQDRIGYGHGYTLLRLGGTQADTGALQRAFAALGAPLQVLDIAGRARRATSTGTISCCCGPTCTWSGAATPPRASRKIGGAGDGALSRSVLRGRAAVDRNHRAGHEAPRRRRQQQRQPLDLVGLRNAVPGAPGSEFLRHLGLAMHPAAGDVGEERPRRDRIDPYIVGREVDSGLPHDIADGRLGRDIAVADQRVCAQAGDRGGGDDAAAASPFHLGGGEADRHECRGQVQLDGTLEQRHVHRVDRAVWRDLEAGTGGDAGIGEHRVEPAVTLRGRVDRVAQRFAVADSTTALYRTSRRLSRAVALSSPAASMSASTTCAPFSAITSAKAEAEPARRAGDEGDVASDVEQVLLLHVCPFSVARSSSQCSHSAYASRMRWWRSSSQSLVSMWVNTKNSR